MIKNPYDINLSLDKIYSIKELQANVKEMDSKENVVPEKDLYEVNKANQNNKEKSQKNANQR